MFWDWLDRTRQKPKAVRDRYAFLGAVSVTGIVVLIWGLSLPTLLKDAGEHGDVAKAEETRGAFSRFFGDVKSQGANVLNSIREEVETASTTATDDQTSEDTSAMMPAYEMQLTASSVQAVTTDNCRGATSSECAKEEQKEPKREGKTVLIGTTSAQRATSTVSE